MKFGYSQFSVKNDPSFKPFDETSLQEIDSSFHLLKNNDFELRLWSINYLIQLRTLFILSHKNNTWSGRFFKMTTNSRGEFVEYQIDSSNFDLVWQELVKNQVLIMPTQNKLRDSKGKIPDINLRDGTTYWFDLLSPKSNRQYIYSCPKSYLYEYPYIQSFKRVVNIIEALYKIAYVKNGPC